MVPPMRTAFSKTVYYIPSIIIKTSKNVIALGVIYGVSVTLEVRAVKT